MNASRFEYLADRTVDSLKKGAQTFWAGDGDLSLAAAAASVP
jgi:hypothetical protein